MEVINSVIESLELLISEPDSISHLSSIDLQNLFSIYRTTYERMKQDIKFYKFKHLREAQYYQAKYLLYPSFIDKVEICFVEDETSLSIAKQKHDNFILWIYEQFKSMKHNFQMIDKYGSDMKKLWDEIVKLRDIDIKRTFNKTYELIEKEIFNTNEENDLTPEDL